MNNSERKNSVKKEIYRAALNLLHKKNFSDISISEITKTANVSRNSFYRNFSSKEDILESYIKLHLSTWKEEQDKLNIESTNELFGSLFHHLKENGDFYVQLKKQNLFNLFYNAYLELYGPKESHSNLEAYVLSFIAGGVLGWIEEWINRGMQESAESMATLLVSNNINPN